MIQSDCQPNQNFTVQAAEKKCFTGTTDRFQGITINSSEEGNLTKEELSEKLKCSLEKWKAEVLCLTTYYYGLIN